MGGASLFRFTARVSPRRFELPFHLTRTLVQFASMVRAATFPTPHTRFGRTSLLVAVAVALCVGATAGNARQTAPGSDLKVFTTRAIATVLHEIRGDVERNTGRKLSVTADVAIRLVRRVKAGEAFDVLVAAPSQIDELIADGMIIRETRTDIARSGIGVAVRHDAPKPDVGSLEAFTRALANARSIAYLKEGQSGLYIAGVLDRLGIADQIKPKLTLPDTDIVAQLVSRGEVELGIVVITQILTTDGVSLAGALPPEIQSYITFTGGLSINSQALEPAKELLRMLQGPAAIAVMRSQGMEPGTPPR
jgi:molybdate transport system substrate-binding protein